MGRIFDVEAPFVYVNKGLAVFLGVPCDRLD
jgi:hypothetical protein